MEISFLVKIAADEEKAETYLIEKGVLKTFTECPYCGNKHFGKVRRGTYKCYKCKREWSPRKGSILEGSRISYGKFPLRGLPKKLCKPQKSSSKLYLKLISCCILWAELCQGKDY